MTIAELRDEIKKIVDQLPADRLHSLADYAHFLEHPSIAVRVRQAEKQIAAGQGVDWRQVRDDV